MHFVERMDRRRLVRTVLLVLVLGVLGASIAPALQGGGTPFGPKRDIGMGGKDRLIGKPSPP
jgi:hypothetical protein